MNESGADRQRELMAMTPRERLDLARRNPISRKIVFAKDTRLLEARIDAQISYIERRLPDTRIDVAIKKSIWALVIGPLIMGFVSWTLSQLFGAPIGFSTAQAAGWATLIGMALGSLDLIKSLSARRHARELADAYGVPDIQGISRCRVAAHLWMTRMDTHLEPLAEGVARATATSPEDPHLHAARNILNELRERQNGVFTQLYRRHPVQKFCDVRRRTEEVSTAKLLEQGLALLAKVGASQHTETSYRGVRVVVEAGAASLKDAVPATAPAHEPASKKRT